MAAPSPEPEIKAFDPTGMSIEERLARLEQLVETFGKHQVSLGNSLLRLHQEHVSVMRDFADAGISQIAAENREDKQPVIIQPAALVNPGGHPLRKERP